VTSETFRGPGEIIRQAIADGPRWMCQKYVARKAGISEKHLSQIVRGGVRMSARVAVRLEGPLGVPALDLLVAQALVDIAVAKAEQAGGCGQTGKVSDPRHVEPLPSRLRNRSRCSCGCGGKQTHVGKANGLALTSGCELSIRRWVRDGWPDSK